MKGNNFNSLDGFFSHGMALSKVVTCDFQETIKDLEGFGFDELFEFIRDFNYDYYYSDFTLKEKDYNCEIKDDIQLKFCSITGTDAFKMKFKECILDCNMPIIESFNESFHKAKKELEKQPYFETLNREYLEYYHKESTYFQDLIVIQIEKFLMREKFHRLKEPFIIVFEEFKESHVSNLSKNIVGIIAKSFKNESYIDYRYVSLLDIPIVKSKYHFQDNDFVGINTYKNYFIVDPDPIIKTQFIREYVSKKRKKLTKYFMSESKIKLYAPIVDSRFIEHIVNIPYYEGIGPFRTEYMYKAFGMIPNEKIVYKEYLQTMHKIVKSNKELMIRIPDIRPEKQIGFLGDITTDLINLNKHRCLFDSDLSNIAKIFGDYDKLSIVIPMIMSPDEIQEWYLHVFHIFSRNLKPMPKLGIMLSTEATYDYLIDYTKTNLDFIIIGLNDFFEEVKDICRYKDLSHQEFIDKCTFHLRDIHQLLRQYNIRHILMGNMLRNEEILHKLIKMGCKEFCIPLEHAHQSFDVIDKYLKNKGKYKGFLEKQMTLTAQRKHYFEVTGKKPRNRYPKIRKKPLKS